eukprot:scaffold24612_cov31-Tisochrysis_lutea.AAC.2
MGPTYAKASAYERGVAAHMRLVQQACRPIASRTKRAASRGISCRSAAVAAGALTIAAARAQRDPKCYHRHHPQCRRTPAPDGVGRSLGRRCATRAQTQYEGWATVGSAHLAEPRKLGMRVSFGGLGINAAGGFANEREPLLPLASAIRRDEVLLLTEEDLIGNVFDVGGAVRREGGITGEARVASIGLRGDANGVTGKLARLGIVERATSRSRGGEAAGALSEPVHHLAHLRPDPICAH